MPPSSQVEVQYSYAAPCKADDELMKHKPIPESCTMAGLGSLGPRPGTNASKNGQAAVPYWLVAYTASPCASRSRGKGRREKEVAYQL